MKYRTIRAKMQRVYNVPNPLNAPYIINTLEIVEIGKSRTGKAAWEIAIKDQKMYSDEGNIFYAWDVEKI